MYVVNFGKVENRNKKMAASTKTVFTHVFHFGDYEKMGYANSHLDCYVPHFLSLEDEFDGGAPCELVVTTREAIPQTTIKKMVKGFQLKDSSFNQEVEEEERVAMELVYKHERPLYRGLEKVIERNLELHGLMEYKIHDDRIGYQVWGSTLTLLRVRKWLNTEYPESYDLEFAEEK
jgi:hypothetical protein